MSNLIDPRRLLAGGVVTLAILLPVYFLLLRSNNEEAGGIRRASLLDTTAAPASRGVGTFSDQTAPDFEISMPHGERVRLSSLRGRPVLINFWSTWCTSCLSEMPEIKALQSERGMAFAVLAVNAGETREQALEFVEFLDAPFVYGLDTGLDVADAYGVYGLPLSVFVDADGIIRGVYRGHADRARLDALVTAAIEARPAPDLPVLLRPVTTIPRDSGLRIEPIGAREMVFSSRSLRCDTSYCAESVAESVKAIEGVISVRLGKNEAGDPMLRVGYRPEIIDEVTMRSALLRIALSLDDPLYPLSNVPRP